MDEPLLGEGPGDRTVRNSDPQGRLIPQAFPIPSRKSEHPTLSLISPRNRSSISPAASPRLPNDSFFSFFLNKEQGRRTEKFYVQPSNGAPYFQQFPPLQSFPVPRRSSTPTNAGSSGSSLKSMFMIPENLPAASGLAPITDLEAVPQVEEQRRDHEWRETESVTENFCNVESCHEREEFDPALYPGYGKDETTLDVEPPDIRNFDIKKVKEKKHLHKCRTAPVLSSVAAASSPNAECGAETKKKVSNEITASGIVWQASVGLLVYLFVGVMFFCWKKDDFKGVETVGWIDALYFCIVTMCTIGYGDITPTTPVAKMLSCALVLVGFGFIDALMSGMVTFVLHRQENLLMNVVLDGRHEVAKGYVLNSEKGTMRIRLKMLLAIGTVLGSISAGAMFLHFVESMNWIDSFYVTVISITTVGYGDYSFQTMWGRLFAAVWLLLSTLAVARAFLFLAEARVQKRQRHFARRMLQSKLTATDLMDADIDHDGHVSIAEYVVYKLKAMHKINRKDIIDIVKQFEQLDEAGVGKISMVQLLEAEALSGEQTS